MNESDTQKLELALPVSGYQPSDCFVLLFMPKKLSSIQATLTSYPYDFKASVLSLKKYGKKHVHAA